MTSYKQQIKNIEQKIVKSEFNLEIFIQQYKHETCEHDNYIFNRYTIIEPTFRININNLRYIRKIVTVSTRQLKNAKSIKNVNRYRNNAKQRKAHIMDLTDKLNEKKSY